MPYFARYTMNMPKNPNSYLIKYSTKLAKLIDIRIDKIM